MSFDEPAASDPSGAWVSGAVVAGAVGGEPPAVPPGHDAPHGSPGEGPHVLTYAGLLLGGIVLGMVGVILAASRSLVRGTAVPWGLVLVLATILACVRGAAWLIGSRRGALLVALGWVLPTLAFATTNPGGDILLPDESRTYVYLGGAVVLILLAACWPLPAGARELAVAHRSRGRHGHGASDDLAVAAVDRADPVDPVVPARGQPDES